MAQQVLPLRFRILHLLSDNGSYTIDEIMEALKSEYAGEGQFTKPLMATHLQSLKAVGMLEHSEVFFDEKGELMTKFKITEYGFSRLSYLPAGWNSIANSFGA